MPPLGCTITSLFQLWSPQGCCNLFVSLTRDGLSLSLIFFAYVFSRFGYPLSWCPIYPRTCVPSTENQSLAGILQCTCLFSVRVLPFLVPLYPRPCVPSTKIQSVADILHCTCLFFIPMLPFWCSIAHAHCVPSTELQSLAGILQCTFFSSPVRVLPFVEPLPLFSAFPCTSTFCPAL